MDIRFEWDEAKAMSNIRKHGVSFEEATTIFGDPNTITIFDTEHSDVEKRFIDIGISMNGRVLVLVYTERGRRIRIISCRKATLAERRQYERESI